MNHFLPLSFIVDRHMFDPPSIGMVVDTLPASDSPGNSDEQWTFEKEAASLQTYLDALPYETESIAEMHAKLEGIVGKIYICVKAKNWLVLTTWDTMLQW